MATCLIGLGSNLGDRRQALDQAVRRFRRHCQVHVTATSRWHETTPVGGPPGQEPFLNGAAVLETALEPEALLAVLHRIEADFGRSRTERWGPRRLDLDLLLYGELALETAALTIPHPRMAWRRFVLEPAAEVAREMVHPATGWTIGRLLHHLNTAVPYVAIAGPIGVGKTRLADELADDRARRASATRIREQVAPGRLEAFYADPSGNAWAMELEFLRERTRLLSAGLSIWSERERLWVSDFWFNQGLAYAGVWLAPERWEEYGRQWEDARRTVVSPKLTVVLDASADRLLERIRRRGRRGERHLSVETLGRIRQALLAQASQPGQGPVLRLSEQDPTARVDEVSAAVEAMG
jgi:2-amino-4-hydroxy-6-hydroxymethyldihydropteridine diphosphokinase